MLLLDQCFAQQPTPNTTSIDSSSAAERDTLAPVALVAAPRAVWASETDDLIAEDLSDFSKLSPSLQPLDYGSLGQFSPLAFRGGSPQATMVALDGFALHEPILGFVNSTSVPINLIEQTSFPGGAETATGLGQSSDGVLELETYSFQGKRPFSKVLFRAGDWGYSDLGLILGMPVTKDVNFTMAGSRQEIDGFEANRKHTGGKFISKLAYHARKNLRLNYLGMLNTDDVRVPAVLLPDLVPRVANGRRKENRLDQLVTLRVGNPKAQDNLLDAKMYLSRIRQESFGDSLLFENRNFSIGTGLQFKWYAGAHVIRVGGEARLDDLTSAQLGNRSDQAVNFDLTDRWKISRKSTLTFSVQLQKKNGYSLAVNPWFGLQSSLSTGTKVWINAKRTTRYPSFSERFWPSDLFRGDPRLPPEKRTSLEVGADLLHGRRIHFTSSVFTRFAENWIGSTMRPDSVFGAANLGNRNVTGLDLRFLWRIYSGGTFGLNGAYLHVREKEPEKRLQVPEYSLYSYIQIGRHFFENFVFLKLRLAGRLYGGRSGYSYSATASFPAIVELAEKALLDAQLILQFKDARLAFSMENLLDERYQLVPGFFMPPKTFRFAVVWEFWD